MGAMEDRMNDRWCGLIELPARDCVASEHLRRRDPILASGAGFMRFVIPLPRSKGNPQIRRVLPQEIQKELQVRRYGCTFKFSGIWVETQQSRLRACTRFPDVDIFDEISIRINIFHRVTGVRSPDPFRIAL